MSSEYIKTIQTQTGNKQIDYTALANLPVIPEIDNGLITSGKAADAKITGDKIKEKINAPKDSNGNILNGTSGQILASDGNGGTTWITVVNASEVAW